jgi:outer membrane protein assembly factor BamB
VIAATPEFELLATNDMTFDSSGFGGTPAISDGQMFLRSHTHLYCIAED